ncbi:hypothetical protein AB8613_15000 [Vibrio sp. BS-M-Sm-2]|uniref:hypothetical protein n=1 Tax=Vibrio sp. BS-M-Sm-2 TaxID=3241167 RepID=UPI003558F49C
MKFAPEETPQAYMETLDDYLVEPRRPVALYPDKYSIFRICYPERDGDLTQFTSAINTLDIETIHANSAWAKGHRLRYCTVTVFESFDGEITALSHGRKLDGH